MFVHRHVFAALALVLMASSNAAWAQDSRATAMGMGVVDVGPPAEPTPAPDPAALQQLAARLAQSEPQPSASPQTPVDPERPEVEARPLGSASRAGEMVMRDQRAGQDGSWILNTLASLGLVIGLILLLRWGWSRFGGGVVARSSPVVEVLSRTSIAPRNHVLLVRVGGRILVLGDSAGGLRTLANLDEPDEVANLLEAVTSARSNSVTRGFIQMLSQSDERYEKVRLQEEGGDDGEFRIDRARETVSGLLARVKAMSGRGS